MASSKAMGTLTGVSKSAASARTSGPMGPQPATDRPWNRPGKAPPTELLAPVGGLMDDQLEFQNSVFWAPQVLDAVQDIIEEEALFYKPVHKSDKWDRLEMDGRRWLICYHGSTRVQRFRPNTDHARRKSGIWSSCASPWHGRGQSGIGT